MPAQDKPVVGMAIKITEENAAKIAVVNGGVVPGLEGFYTGSYFVFPYDPDAHNRILPGYVFELNWKAADKVLYPVNEHFFVDIIEI